jgi:hypothetical protein
MVEMKDVREECWGVELETLKPQKFNSPDTAYFVHRLLRKFLNVGAVDVDLFRC